MPELRWAARFAFVDELWRGRSRIVVDAGLEAWLRASASSPGARPASVAELVDDLLPISPGRTEVWMVVQSPAIAGRLASTRPGTRFVVRDALPNLLARAAWQTLLLDLRVLAHEPRDLPLALARSGVDAIEARRGQALVFSSVVEDDGSDAYAAVSRLLDRTGGGRVFGLFTPAITGVVELGVDDEDDVEDELEREADGLEARAGELVVEVAAGEGEAREGGALETGEDEPPGARDEGASVAGEGGLPASADLEAATDGGVEQGEASDELGSVGDDDFEDEGDFEDDTGDDEVPLFYDNTLGAQDPEPFAYLGIGGDPDLVGIVSDGVSLIELPPGAAVHDDDATTAPVFTRADVIEPLPVDEASPSRAGLTEDLESALAREQALAWRVRQLEEQLDAALARPVHELEAEVAHLRALLARKGSTSGSEGPDGEGGTEPFPSGSEGTSVPTPGSRLKASNAEVQAGPPEIVSEDRPRGTESESGIHREEILGLPAGRVNGARPDGVLGYGVGSVASEAPYAVRPALRRVSLPSPAADGGRATQVVLRMVDGLVRRIERGGIGTLALRKELVALRRRLT